ncbi:MAG: IPT/TIG domain-containing protein [Thermoanaerobaculia bacterium]|nr:IPT/TIG domain-containing protein [Thermoanaerobaculia bacterium]
MQRCAIVSVFILSVVFLAEAGPRRRPVRVPRPPLIVSTIDPNSGPIAGGSTVTIRGSGFFASDLRVAFDNQPAASVTLVSASELLAVAPPHANGYAAVRVVNHGRIASTQFLYVPPSLDSISDGEITTVAGIGLYLGEGAPAKSVPFDVAGFDLVVDTDGSVLVLEPDRLVVRRIAPDGTCTRLAGTGMVLSPQQVADGEIGDGGPATETTADGRGITIGPDGAVYLATLFQHRIRRIDRATGVITTVAGSGPITYQGSFAGDGGPATAARLDQPNQVAFDRRGNMFILDAFNYRVRRVSPDGVITTIAGNGTRGFSGDGGPATLASFDIGPNGDGGTLRIDAEGNLFLADAHNRRVRRIDATTGVITTILGGGTQTDEGAMATETAIRGPVNGIAISPDGSIYFGDGSRIRRVGTDGRVTTVFGELTPGFSEDGVRSGRLSMVEKMEVDAVHNRLLFGERSVNRIRSIDLATGTLSTIAGIGPAVIGENGPAIAAELGTAGGDEVPFALNSRDELLIGTYSRLQRLNRDGTLLTLGGFGTRGVAAAPNGDIYITGPYDVGRISPEGTYTRLAGNEYGYSGDGGPASAANLDNPAGIVIDGAGNLFVADKYNHCIRRIDAQSGIITTFAGRAPIHLPNVQIENPSTGDGGPAVDAQLRAPIHLALDGAGNLYVSDVGGVRMIDRNGIIDTVVANRCQGGPLTSDSSGRVYAYCFGGAILRIDGKNSTTTIGTISPEFGFTGDGGPATAAKTRTIQALAIDRSGNVYLWDFDNRRVRAIRGIAR